MIQRVLAVAVIFATMLTPVGCAPAGPSKPDVADLPSFTFVADATNGHKIHIQIDATDQFGNHGHNSAEGGLPYPWDGVRPTIYRHTIYYEPGIIVSARMRIYALSGVKPGDTLRCWVEVNGVEVPASRSSVTVVGSNSTTVCLYTGGK